jgi:hypothetical protein
VGLRTGVHSSGRSRILVTGGTRTPDRPARSPATTLPTERCKICGTCQVLLQQLGGRGMTAATESTRVIVKQQLTKLLAACSLN